MPAGRAETAPKPGAAKRPPWVREGPQALPMPTAPWAVNKRASLTKEPDADGLPPRRPSSSNGQGQSTDKPSSKPSPNPAAKPSTDKPSSKPSTDKQAAKPTEKSPHVFERPTLRPTNKEPPATNTKLQSREVKVPVQVNRRESREMPPGKVVRRETAGKRQESSSSESEETESESEEEPTSRRNSWLSKVELKPVVVEPKKIEKENKLPKVELKPIPKNDAKDREIDKAVPSERCALVRNDTMKKLFPAPPPMPPMPPPPPPPEVPFVKRDPLSRQQIEKIESLKSRPRKRPDWGAMMKDIECGRKLKHVQCNDRSQPLLPKNKDKGQFIYESEQANLHNQLLKQIQSGRKLNHVKTNDRSKPILEGLRKFRRQMTIEEQIIKSQSMAAMPQAEVEEEVDEMDDIDKVRDDLQSTKQMLALELRNKEAQIRENKRLLSRLQSLEAEIEKMKAGTTAPAESQSQTAAPAPADDKVVKSLKEEVTTAKKTAEEMEKKYHDTADQLDSAKNELDEAKRQNRELEKKLQQAMQGIGQKRQSFDRRESIAKPPPEEEEEEFELESEDSGGEETEEKKQRRAEREIRMLGNKIKSLKNKQEASKRERKMLRDQMKKNQQAMKEEKKKYKNLQKEVNKMAALMKDDEEEEEDEESAEEEETEEEESSSESESSESEEESSSEEEEDLSLEERRTALQGRVKRREACLNALKKGNYLLKANADRLQDDLNKQKEAVATLQEDLDSVLAELG